MDSILTKYNKLSPEVQQEVNDFLDFMLSKNESKNVFNLNKWKSKIKDVSVWTDQDIQRFEESRQQFNQWKTEEW